jgi:hypothetical protein
MKFPPTGTYSSSKKKKKSPGKKLSYDVHDIQFTTKTPLADLVIPDNCSQQTQVYIDRATEYLESLTPKRNPTRQKHDLKRPCVVCKKSGHTFEDCEILKDTQFLRDALIKSSMYFDREVKRRASATADQLEATHARREKKHEKKQVNLLHSISTMRAMCDDSDSDSDCGSSSSSEARYLDEVSDDDDDEDFC